MSVPVRFPQGMVAALLTAAAFAGCENRPTPAANGRAASLRPQAVSAPIAPAGRSEIELSGATAFLDDLGIVRFTIHYEFTSGAPTKFYQCDIAFPGTDRYGIKPMTADELMPEGSFNTGIEVEDAPVRDFTVTLSEADSPDQGYHLISNTLHGVVETPPARTPADSSH